MVHPGKPMADPTKDQKTEDPTPKRKRQLRSEGQIARSPDVGSAVALGGLYLIFRFLVPQMGAHLGGFTTSLLGELDSAFQEGLLGSSIAPTMVAVLTPPIALAVVFAVVAGVGQTRGAIATKALKPRLSRLSPKKGMERFKPTTMAFEAFRVILKTALLVAVLWIPVQGIINSAPGALSLSEWISFTSQAISAVLLWATVLAALIAAVDYGHRRYKHVKSSRMSKQQVREEFKESDGDPRLKQARRERARELSRNRMIVDVASADVLLINPIRFAVALTYVENEGAPRVVARGAGAFAQRLRREAYRNGVVVRQDIPLTRALYRRCRVGQFVPPELYEAVAVVLAAVYRRRTQRAMRSTRRVAA